MNYPPPPPFQSQPPVQMHYFAPYGNNWLICAHCGGAQPDPVHLVTQAVTHKGLTGGQHLMHLLLDLCTGGLWIPFHIIFALRGRDQVTRYRP